VVWKLDGPLGDGTWNPTEVKVTQEERIEGTYQKAVFAVKFMCYRDLEYYTGAELSEMVSDAWETQISKGIELGATVDIVHRWENEMKREQKKEVAGLVNTLEHSLKTGQMYTCPGSNQLARPTAPDVPEMRPEVNNRKYCPCYPCISNISSSLPHYSYLSSSSSQDHLAYHVCLSDRKGLSAITNLTTINRVKRRTSSRAFTAVAGRGLLCGRWDPPNATSAGCWVSPMPPLKILALTSCP
jgi:hypothetical protein